MWEWILSTACLFAPLTTWAAEQWIDLTEQYIINPSFDNDESTGWTWTSDAHSQTLRCEAMEFWNGTWYLYQTLRNVPAGHYRLSVKAYYRCGDNDWGYQDYLNGTENITGMMFAGQAEQPLVSIYSYCFESNVPGGCWSYTDYDTWMTVYFPNTMESGTEAFNRGGYVNAMEFDHEGGDLTIGLRNDNWVQSNWCLFDDFQLEYYGEVVPIESITLEPNKAEMVAGETLQITATVAPENATIKKLQWRSSRPQVATVDDKGLVTAIGKGSSRITAISTDGNSRTAGLTVTVTNNPPTSESVIINEIMSSNVDEYVSPAFNFDGWVEFYNPTDRSVEMGGIYMSDDADNLKKWHTPADLGVIPANGYLVVWFDSNGLRQQNAIFKLDTDGGTLYISDADGKLLCSQDYPASMERVSYARTTDGGKEWNTTSTPTLGASNNNATFATQQLAPPVVNQPSQLFTGTISLSVDIPAGCTLRYTTDGTLPTLQNGATSRTGQFSISKTSQYRFRLFADGYLPSTTTTRSFIYMDRDYEGLPVVSVVSDPRFLYDDSLGVYVRGKNGRPGNGQSSKCNWNMDWERPVNFSYLDANGEMVLNQDVDLEMCGGWSRAWTPHSFKLKGSKELGGEKKLAYPFFTAKPYINNRTLQIRNGGNDNGCRIKDPAIQTIVQTSGIDVDVQSYQPVHEFINGQYIGVLNVREPNNKHYVYANYGWDDDEIDQFEISPDSFYVQKCGDDKIYQQLVSLSAYANDDGIYKDICKMLNIDEYVNYMAAEMYLGSDDWLRNNIKAFRHRDGGRFRFVMFDTDHSFNRGSNMFNDVMNMEKNYHFNALLPSGKVIVADITLITIFRQLLQNESFRRKFIDTYCMMGGSVFEATRCTEIIDQLTAVSGPAMAINNESPYGTANSMKNSFNSREQTMTNAIRNFSQMKITSSAQRVTLASNTDGARIEVNGIDVPTGSFNGHLFQPVKLKAVAPAGYTFLGWRNNTGTQSEVFGYGGRWTYYDQGSLDGQSWTANNYSTSKWKTGNAPLGYSMSGIATTISYGSNSNNKYPTYYFRRTFSLKNKPASNAVFTLNYKVDDGFVVYINGTEAARYNMPSGNVNFNTWSSTYANSTPFEGSLNIKGSLFKEGSNLICVEVHQCSATSSDVYFDASLFGDLGEGDSDDYLSTDAEINLPNGTVNLVATYRKMTDTERKDANLHPVCINEVSAANSVYVNEYSKKNDWVELYNTTDTEQDVEGMFLTDNLEKIKKHQITKGQTTALTRIPAHGRLIIWCDKLETTNQALHADFKLAAEGGVVALSAADLSWTDSLHYVAHDGNHTVGRYPDGGSDVYLMDVPSIAKANQIGSYDTVIDQKTLDVTPSLVASANGLRLRCVADMLLLASDDAQYARIDILNGNGQLIESNVANFHAGHTQLSIAHLPAGFYIARATDNLGNTVGCKVLCPLK